MSATSTLSGQRKGTAISRAFQCRGRRCEAQRMREQVRPPRIPARTRRGRCRPRPAYRPYGLEKPASPAASPSSSSHSVPFGPRVTARKDLVSVAIFCSAFRLVGDAGGGLQRLVGKDQMRRGGEQAFALRDRAVDIDHDGNAALARRVAQVRGKSWRSGFRSGSRRNPSATRRRRAASPSTSPGSRNEMMVRSPDGSIMMPEIGVTRPGICTRCVVSMPLWRGRRRCSGWTLRPRRPSARSASRGRRAG